MVKEELQDEVDVGFWVHQQSSLELDRLSDAVHVWEQQREQVQVQEEVRCNRELTTLCRCGWTLYRHRGINRKCWG